MPQSDPDSGHTTLVNEPVPDILCIDALTSAFFGGTKK